MESEMRKTLYLIVTLLIVSILLAACGGGESGGDANVEAGKDLFSQSVIGSQAGCITCHSLSQGEVIVGPSMAGIGSRGDAAYIRESIVDPNAVLVDGFSADTMPNVWAGELTEEQIDQLVDYLLTLK
jgi:mono/diheme cytochrome c family protein